MVVIWLGLGWVWASRALTRVGYTAILGLGCAYPPRAICLYLLYFLVNLCETIVAQVVVGNVYHSLGYGFDFYKSLYFLNEKNHPIENLT